jgi:molybdopterin molybdotransferase
VISFEDALADVLTEARALESESVAVGEAGGRFLHSDLVAAHDSPRFDNSAVDGYAVRSSDLAAAPVSLRIIGTVYAGDDASSFEIKSGECARTMTGATVVRGADAVVMQEDVTVDGDRAHFAEPAKAEQAVRRAGEEYRAGDLLVTGGSLCTPSVLALAAAQGLAKVDVGRRPRVGIVVTGSELAKPGTALTSGQIYESNSVALSVAARALTGVEPLVRSVGDDKEATRNAFESIVAECDVVVFSGGASVGEKDLVRSTLLECGMREVFWRISMKPGKPVFFGVHTSGALVFALPGNPVSAQVTFELLVAPAVLKMSGARSAVPVLEKAVLGSCIKRVAGRKEFIRSVSRNEGGRVIVEPLARQGSHMASGLAVADRLVVVEPDVDCLDAGTLVDTVQLRWSVLR